MLFVGKVSLGEEISTLALNSAEYLLHFAHRSQQPELVKDCVDVRSHMYISICKLDSGGRAVLERWSHRTTPLRP